MTNTSLKLEITSLPENLREELADFIEFLKMKTMTKKTFDAVKYFRMIKEKLASKLLTMSLEDQKEFLRKIREGEIKL